MNKPDNIHVQICTGGLFEIDNWSLMLWGRAILSSLMTHELLGASQTPGYTVEGLPRGPLEKGSAFQLPEY